MTPEHIKKKVQDAYVKALEDHSTQWQRASGIQHLFRDVRLYGRDAGIDFVETHLDAIVHEAVETAGTKGASLPIVVHGFGRAALEGMADALREFTALKVEAKGSTLALIWAEADPGLVQGR